MGKVDGLLRLGFDAQKVAGRIPETGVSGCECVRAPASRRIWIDRPAGITGYVRLLHTPKNNNADKSTPAMTRMRTRRPWRIFSTVPDQFRSVLTIGPPPLFLCLWAKRPRYQSSERYHTPTQRATRHQRESRATLFGFVNRGVAQPGRAPGSGPGGRRFESSRPDLLKKQPVSEAIPKRADVFEDSPNSSLPGF